MQHALSQEADALSAALEGDSNTYCAKQYIQDDANLPTTLSLTRVAIIRIVKLDVCMVTNRTDFNNQLDGPVLLRLMTNE